MKTQVKSHAKRGHHGPARKRSAQDGTQSRTERSTLTRRRILEAALDCIAENGYEGATMDLIVAHAGVSRGAQMHHFPRKLILAAEAMSYMLDSLIVDLRNRTEAIRLDKQSPSQLFMYLWETYFSGRLFKVTMQLIVAAGTNDELRTQLTPIADKFHRNLDDCWYLLCRKGEHDDVKLVNSFNLTMALLRGFGFQMTLWNRPEAFKELLNEWLEIMSAYISTQKGQPRSPAHGLPSGG